MHKERPLSLLAKKLFDIDPEGISLSYSNQNLNFWEGGCTWIGEQTATIQLRKVFERREQYWGYSKEEIVAHELVHVVRRDLDEPIFEEILAYKTSLSKWRRFFGPAFRTPKESLIFLATLSLMALFSLLWPWMYLGVLLLIGAGTVRLLRTHRIFNRARKKMANRVGEERALAEMIHLTDQEIISISQSL